MKAYFYTFGCKVNQYETENIKQNFKRKGFEVTDNIIEADVCVINSCTVTSMSDKKNRQLIHKIKKESPDCITVLTGCFPQAFEDEAEKISEIDIITGSGNKNDIPQLLEEFLNHHKKIVRIAPHTKEEQFEPMKNTENIEKTRAYIKIEDGCDQYCTYCIIPYARGHIRSKPLEELKEELLGLAESGHREVVLVGINLSSYGKDLGCRLIDAIETACSIDSIERVRLGSLEPELISDEDILRMSSQKKLCPQFHLSLQSGCDNTLKDMNRKYNTAEYFEIVRKLREAFDNCSITTDVMVGFPNESEDDFNESLEFVRKVGFAKVHIFPYSKREGTVAAKRSGQLSKSVKNERVKKMTEVTSKSQTEFLKNQIGKVVPVLFEAESTANFHQGYSQNYTLVKINRENSYKSLRRMIFYVKINKQENDYCIGELLTKLKE